MNLQEVRKSQGLEQSELAKRVKTTAPMMSCFENYKCIPTPPMLEAICKELKCGVWDIYDKREIFVSERNVKRVLKSKVSEQKQVYKLTVRLPNNSRNILTQSNLEKCGYHSLKDFIWHCFKRFERQLQIVNKKEKPTKHSDCLVDHEKSYIKPYRTN